MFKDENRHYSLRKLSVGLASVLIGISFASSMNGNSVKADTVKSDSNGVQTAKVNDTVAKGSDAVVRTDAESAPEAVKVPGYKTVASPVNPARALFAVSFIALPKPIAPAINDTKPAETVSPATPVAIEVAKPIKTEPKIAIIPKTINLSNDVIAIAPKETTWQVADNLEHDTYYVSNGKYTVELPHISNAQLHVIANDSTKDSVLFTYKGQNTKYVFNIKFVNGHYLLTTYEIKSDKLVKLIDYNFIKSSKMIDVILDWLKR